VKLAVVIERKRKSTVGKEWSAIIEKRQAR